MSNTTVVIFGVFDGVHPGHEEFIKQARMHGDRLVAIVARDQNVYELKGKLPQSNEALRIKNLSEISEIDIVYLGDLQQGTYNIVKEIKPDIVYLGYDQEHLYESLTTAIEKGTLPQMKLIFGKPYKTEEFKSSIINQKEVENN